MKTVKGIYAEAKIFTDDVEEYAQAQVKMICDHQAAEGSRIRLMPDIHPGKVGPIGLSMTATDKVIPQLLGVDIGCGMTCVKLNSAHMVHPTEKPVELMKDIITSITREGDIILDAFAGSGSALVAAKQTGRRYIGIELDDGYYQTAQQRLEAEA